MVAQHSPSLCVHAAAALDAPQYPCACGRTDIDLTLTDWQEGEDELRTKWRFSATLSGLPWKPLLAAAGGTTFVFDPASG